MKPASYALPCLKNKSEDLLNQITALENEKTALGAEILGLRNSIHENNEAIGRQNRQSRKLGSKLNRVRPLIRNTEKEPKYQKAMKILDQRLNDRKSSLLAALVAVKEKLG